MYMAYCDIICGIRKKSFCRPRSKNTNLYLNSSNFLYFLNLSHYLLARELSSNDMVLPKALEIVASMIGNDWESLSNRMGINRNLKKPIDNMFQWNKQTISEYLLENQKLFSWIQLYDILEALNRKDIIDEVVKDTFLTEGIIIFKRVRSCVAFIYFVCLWNVYSLF